MMLDLQNDELQLHRCLVIHVPQTYPKIKHFIRITSRMDEADIIPYTLIEPI